MLSDHDPFYFEAAFKVAEVHRSTGTEFADCLERSNLALALMGRGGGGDGGGTGGGGEHIGRLICCIMLGWLWGNRGIGEHV